MFKTRDTVLALLVACWSAFPSCARAATIEFQFDASLQTGALAGTQFTGLASYDNSGVTGIGTEYLMLTSLDFTLLGSSFTQADISQGGQAILQNGTLSYFTAAIFPDYPAVVDDIAFGFGGPGVIGYSTPPGFNPGVGAYTIEIVPEPSTVALSMAAIFAFPLLRGRFERGCVIRRMPATLVSSFAAGLKPHSPLRRRSPSR